jgi:hypothetical protein
MLKVLGSAVAFWLDTSSTAVIGEDVHHPAAQQNPIEHTKQMFYILCMLC